jgi:hypothetical protein
VLRREGHSHLFACLTGKDLSQLLPPQPERSYVDRKSISSSKLYSTFGTSKQIL